MNKISVLLYWGLILFLTGCIIGCQKDDAIPEPKPQSKVADFKVVLSIDPSSCYTSFKVTKGEEPNIYRDGVLVSQGDYTSQKEQSSSRIQTSFSHRGRKLKVTVELKTYYGNTFANPSIRAVLYRNGTMVSEFSKSYELRPRDGSAIADFELYAQADS